MKYIKTYNEKLADKLLPPSEDDIIDKLKSLKTEDIIEKSIEKNFKAGIKYVIDERKNELTDDEIYILEKYILGLHQDEEREYEAWFKEQLTGLESNTFGRNSVYGNNKIPLYNYNLENKIFYIDYEKIWSVFVSKFNLWNLYIKIITKSMVEKHLNLSVKTTTRIG